MKITDSFFTTKQLLFQEIFIGTLIYVTVLGFFNDYTTIVYATSFSTIFFASIVLEILTYLTFGLKSRIVAWLQGREGRIYRVLMFFSVWLIMFLSKFVLIWVLSALFGSYISINGFFGILAVVLCVTVIHKLTYKVFNMLG